MITRHWEYLAPVTRALLDAAKREMLNRQIDLRMEQALCGSSV